MVARYDKMTKFRMVYILNLHYCSINIPSHLCSSSTLPCLPMSYSSFSTYVILMLLLFLILLLLCPFTSCSSCAPHHYATPSPLFIMHLLRPFSSYSGLLRPSFLLVVRPFHPPPVPPPPSQINNNMTIFHSNNIAINCRNSNKNMSEISSSFTNNLRQYHDQCHQYNIIEINKLDKNSHLNIVGIFWWFIDNSCVKLYCELNHEQELST